MTANFLNISTTTVQLCAFCDSFHNGKYWSFCFYLLFITYFTFKFDSDVN